MLKNFPKKVFRIHNPRRRVVVQQPKQQPPVVPQIRRIYKFDPVFQVHKRNHKISASSENSSLFTSRYKQQVTRVPDGSEFKYSQAYPTTTRFRIERKRPAPRVNIPQPKS